MSRKRYMVGGGSGRYHHSDFKSDSWPLTASPDLSRPTFRSAHRFTEDPREIGTARWNRTNPARFGVSLAYPWNIGLQNKPYIPLHKGQGFV